MEIKIKKEKESEKIQYYKLVKADSNFAVETITVLDGKVIDSEISIPNYLPIVFRQLNKKASEDFFKLQAAS